MTETIKEKMDRYLRRTLQSGGRLPCEDGVAIKTNLVLDSKGDPKLSIDVYDLETLSKYTAQEAGLSIETTTKNETPSSDIWMRIDKENGHIVLHKPRATKMYRLKDITRDGIIKTNRN